jgi:hypothetical protein
MSYLETIRKRRERFEPVSNEKGQLWDREPATQTVQNVSPNVPTECPACRGRLFWRSIHGVVICWRCHPPGSEKLLADILWDGEVKWHQ